MQQPSSVVHVNYKTYNLSLHKEDTEKKHNLSSAYDRLIARTALDTGSAC